MEPREFSVTCDAKGAVADIVIDNPPVNALNFDIAFELGAIVDGLAARGETRCALVRTTGSRFSAGADLKETLRYNGVVAMRLVEKVNRALDKVAQAPFPVVGVVQGPALGGGLELALCCDMIVASEDAMFGFPEVSLGAVPVYGGIRRLPKTVGEMWAKRLVLMGESIDARTAERIGLVQWVVPQDALLAESRKVAETLATRGPLAVRMAKQLIGAGGGTLCEADYARLEDECFRHILRSKDRAEGVDAFLHKRNPQFAGW